MNTTQHHGSGAEQGEGGSTRLLLEAMDFFGGMVDQVEDDDWDRPTPCAEWNVRDLVNHVTGENLWVPPLLSGRTIAEVGDRFDGDVLGDQPAAAWRTGVDSARTAVSAPDAEGRLVHLSSGVTPAIEYFDQLFADHLIHGWDLAAAIGAETALPDHLVTACAEWFVSWEDRYRGGGVVAARPELPEDADAQTRLLAAFGRTPTEW